MTPGDHKYPSLPNSVEEYRNNPRIHSFPPIDDVISAGCHLRVVKLVRWETLKGNWGVATIAEIIDGPFAKKKVIIDDLLDCSDSTKSGRPESTHIDSVAAGLIDRVLASPAIAA